MADPYFKIFFFLEIHFFKFIKNAFTKIIDAISVTATQWLIVQ